LLNSVQPDMIVITIGANDRQPISDNGQSYQPRSNEWESLYGKRVDALLETLKVFGRPFFWVSAPPMRNGSLSDHMLYVNGLVKPRVEAAGGHFIDIWDGFANKDGHFVGSGPDVDGQVRQLRNRDGINFTRAGRLKLAFYVAREIRRQTGLGAGTVDLLPAVSQTGHIEIGPDGKKRLVGPVISLNDPLPGASDALAGGAETEPAKTPEESLQYRLVVKGEALPTTPGRVDDFAWPRSAREVSSTGTDGGAGLLPVPRPARGPVLKPVSK
jgi:hypothetical protein